ncbi:MAG: L,D-transpeptidase family protein [Candidatus Omnitrophica bacterium]|nr:L,D-transpeptidase family protein [Candidatus Omnitrophota bacterium]
MRRSIKSRAKGSGRVAGGGLMYWVLAAVALAGTGWIWWQTGQVVKSKSIKPLVFFPVSPAIQTNSRIVPPAPESEIQRTLVKEPPVSNVTNTAIPPITIDSGPFPRPVRDIFEAQVALSRQGISSGSLDGVPGFQTRAALRAFQESEDLRPSGELDEATCARLILSAPALTRYTVTQGDLDRLGHIPHTWLGKSLRRRLDYETILELVAEKGHAHPNFIRRLNPAIDWDHVVPGAIITIPDADCPMPKTRAAYVRIHLAWKILEVFDAKNRLLIHFPCSIGRSVEKRPIGELHVISVIHNPNYVFNPDIFPESEEGRTLGRRLVLPPGPNNPVGTAWIGLDRPGYGIHGTPRPEMVGRTESHGCFRLANWNAEFLARLVSVGTPVIIQR